MSYVPYTPDVQPPPFTQAVLPLSRAARWVIGTILYLALIAAWLWWMFLPDRIRSPLATIPLPDGSELRLVHVARGESLVIESDETFGGRIRAPYDRHPTRDEFNGPVSSWSGEGSTAPSGPANCTWLFFTHYYPPDQRLASPSLSGVWIAEENPHFLHPMLRYGNGGSGLPIEAYATTIAPARGATWKVRVNYHGAMVEGTIPNPFPMAPVREFSPKPLPQPVTVEGATVELTGIDLESEEQRAVAFPSWENFIVPRAVPRIKITMGDLHEGAFAIERKFFDATGNVTADGVLPFTEPAWGLHIRARQYRAPSGSSGYVLLGEAILPGPGEIFALPVPPDFARQGVTDALFIGNGAYQISDHKIRTQRRSRKAPPGSPSAKPDSILHELSIASPGVAGIYAPDFSLLMVRRPQATDARSGATEENEASSDLLESGFQIRIGDEIVASSAHWTRNAASSLQNWVPMRQFTVLSGGKKLVPGAKLRIEYFEPKILEATFFFPPPDPKTIRPAGPTPRERRRR